MQGAVGVLGRQPVCDEDAGRRLREFRDLAWVVGVDAPGLGEIADQIGECLALRGSAQRVGPRQVRGPSLSM
jgi:hypothetical protein